MSLNPHVLYLLNLNILYLFCSLVFKLRDITLFIEPGTEVTWGTNVTLRCQAIVKTLGQVQLSRKYSIYRNNNLIYTKTSSSTEDLLYPLHQATLSTTGNYECAITIDEQQMTSRAKKLTVTGWFAIMYAVLICSFECDHYKGHGAG